MRREQLVFLFLLLVSIGKCCGQVQNYTQTLIGKTIPGGVVQFKIGPFGGDNYALVIEASISKEDASNNKSIVITIEQIEPFVRKVLNVPPSGTIVVGDTSCIYNTYQIMFMPLDNTTTWTEYSVLVTSQDILQFEINLRRIDIEVKMDGINSPFEVNAVTSNVFLF